MRQQLLSIVAENSTYFSLNKIFISVTVGLGSLYSKKKGCGSGFIGYGSSISSESGSESRVLMTKNCKNLQMKNLFFLFRSKMAIYPSPGR
jgi:hypothetical protein